MDSIKKYYQMVEDGEIVQEVKEKKYKFSYQELKNFVYLVKLNPKTPDEVLVEMTLNTKK